MASFNMCCRVNRMKLKSVARKGREGEKGKRRDKSKVNEGGSSGRSKTKRTRRSEDISGRFADVHNEPRFNPEKFRTAEHQELYNIRFGGVDVCHQRIVDFESFDKNHASFVFPWFKYQKWDTLVQQREPIYPELVRQFYTHIQVNNRKEGEIKSWVKGKSIFLDNSKLGSILGLRATGVFDYPGNKFSEHPCFSVSKSNKLLLGQEAHDMTSKPNADKLAMESRLLHLIMQQTFVNRDGRRSSLTYLDIFVMYCILDKIKVNIPKIMIEYMYAARKKERKQTLPYGMWLTKVFIFFGVDLNGEVSIQNDRDPFNENSITKNLGYEYDSKAGTWRKSGIKRGNHRVAPTAKSAKGKEKAKDDDDIATTKEKVVEPSVKVRELLIESKLVQKMLQLVYPNTLSTNVVKKLRKQARTEVKESFGKEMSVSDSLQSNGAKDDNDDVDDDDDDDTNDDDGGGGGVYNDATGGRGDDPRHVDEEVDEDVAGHSGSRGHLLSKKRPRQ